MLGHYCVDCTLVCAARGSNVRFELLKCVLKPSHGKPTFHTYVAFSTFPCVNPPCVYNVVANLARASAETT